MNSTLRAAVALFALAVASAQSSPAGTTTPGPPTPATTPATAEVGTLPGQVDALSLERAVELALAGNEISGIATARLEGASALRRQAIAQLIPALTLTGNATRRAREVTRTIDGDDVVVQAINAYSGQAAVDTPLFDLRALPLIRAAGNGEAAQRIESDELRRALAFDVADGFYAVLSLEHLRDAARQRVAVGRQTVDESRIRLEAGLANRNDLTRTQLELASAELGATRAANDVTTARLSLAYLINAPVDGALAVPERAAPPASGRQALVDAALRGRQELVALDERVQQAKRLALAPRLGWVPRLDLRGIYRWTNEAGLSGNSTDWNIGANLTWEVFDGGDRSALAAQRDADAREVELLLLQRRRQVALDVDRATADLATADAALAQAQTQLDVARQNSEEVRERFQNGLATALEQTDAQVSAFEAESAVAQQGFARDVAGLALERALGSWPAGFAPNSSPTRSSEEAP
ncbi:MAG: TolC family protein [Thermoanaerobaculia bacterium]